MGTRAKGHQGCGVIHHTRSSGRGASKHLSVASAKHFDSSFRSLDATKGLTDCPNAISKGSKARFPRHWLPELPRTSLHRCLGSVVWIIHSQKFSCRGCNSSLEPRATTAAAAFLTPAALGSATRAKTLSSTLSLVHA